MAVMEIIIINQTIDPKGTGCIEATCGNKSAYVSTYKVGKWVTICCKNASHMAWRGSGRTFRTFEEALDGYKSPEMKAIIRAANDLIGPASFTPTNVIQFATA